MAYNMDELKLSLYELFNDAKEKVKRSDNSNEREQYLQQAFQTADKIIELEKPESQTPPAGPQL